MWVNGWSIIGAHFVISGTTFKSTNNGRVSVKRNWIETTSSKVWTDWAEDNEAFCFSWWLNSEIIAVLVVGKKLTETPREGSVPIIVGRM